MVRIVKMGSLQTVQGLGEVWLVPGRPSVGWSLHGMVDVSRVNRRGAK